MIKKDIAITNRLGLHARAAAKLVHTAGRYNSEISLVKDGDSVDAKSILGILQLGAAQGTQLELTCDGDDERDAFEAVSHLFADRFGEES